MGERPYTVLSCGVSLDGYLDSATEQRLLLSNDADFDRVDDVRSDSDAILVGAGTVRRDNPALLVRSEERRRRRIDQGLPATPAKVTVTAEGNLDPSAQFFATGECEKYVYCASRSTAPTRASLDRWATVVEGGTTVTMRWVSEDLHQRGVRRLMVEGGGTIHTQFLTEGIADELHLAVAPLFVGDSRAPRFVGDGAFPWCAEHRATLIESRPVGDVVLLRYALSDRARAGATNGRP
jgi:5-amino-6-(5-phosphoribosylamino)uracil reductase